jgi:hypothetical protein
MGKIGLHGFSQNVQLWGILVDLKAQRGVLRQPILQNPFSMNQGGRNGPQGIIQIQGYCTDFGKIETRR